MRALAIALLVAAACGGGGSKTPDAGVTTDNCSYVPLAPTAGAGGTVTAAPLMAGAAERVLDVPVGTALGGYTARAGFLGSAGVVDTRKIALSSTFNPSIGVINAPRVKAVALTAGSETVVIVKVDMIFVYEGMLFDVEQQLGPSFAGKVILASSHSHSAWAQYTGHGPLKLGAGEMRKVVYDRFVSTIVATAQDALSARRSAKIGFSFNGAFDPPNDVNHDRRGENDMLPGGKAKDDHLYVIAIDGTDNVPIAVIPIFGEHGTLNGEDNPFASSDAPGAVERAIQETYSTPVVVMHLQGAAGDNSPSGHGGLDCNVKPGNATDPCFSWATEEGHGRAAVTAISQGITDARASMQSTIDMEMVSRSIETGPYPQTFTIRSGALSYAPFDPNKMPDGVIYNGDGTLASPIDEFNAQVGAGLCESETAMFPAAAIPGTDGILPYGSCIKLDLAAPIFQSIFHFDFGTDATHPVCQTTRTTISALRIGNYVIGTLPGEMTVLLATYLRSVSPMPADHTILVGYSQGHVGYMLRPEDWMMGGYEPSVTFWGPLEAEHIGEELMKLIPLAITPAREDATTDGTTRVATAVPPDFTQAPDDPAPMAGTVPSPVPPDVWSRTGHPMQAQPAATVARVSGLAQFVWIGDDPLVQTPKVRLEVQTSPGVFAPVTRHSGRLVSDGDLVLSYTPEPLQRSGPQTHVWVVEWQAVPWFGATGIDSLDDRGGVPLGTYRFHVDGHGWTLDSQPFAVVKGGLEVTATHSGTSYTAHASWHAPAGYRLMDMTLPSNQPVPVRGQNVQVTLLDSAGTQVLSQNVATDANGAATVTTSGQVSTMQVTDRFGNTASTSVP